MLPPGTERTPPKREKRKSEGKRGKGRRKDPSGASPAAAAKTDATETAPPSTGADAAPAYDRRPRPPERRARKQGSGRPKRERPAGGARSDYKSRAPSRPKSKPPVVPLTNEMKAGKEPLRTFGDLKQFYDLKSQSDKPEEQPAPTAPPESSPAKVPEGEGDVVRATPEAETGPSEA